MAISRNSSGVTFGMMASARWPPILSAAAGRASGWLRGRGERERRGGRGRTSRCVLFMRRERKNYLI
jgi:hypothetical protein